MAKPVSLKNSLGPAALWTIAGMLLVLLPMLENL